MKNAKLVKELEFLTEMKKRLLEMGETYWLNDNYEMAEAMAEQFEKCQADWKKVRNELGA